MDSGSSLLHVSLENTKKHMVLGSPGRTGVNRAGKCQSGSSRSNEKKWREGVWLEVEAAEWHSCFDGGTTYYIILTLKMPYTVRMK